MEGERWSVGFFDFYQEDVQQTFSWKQSSCSIIFLIIARLDVSVIILKPNTYILENRYKINFVLLLMCQKHADTKLTDTVERRKFV